MVRKGNKRRLTIGLAIDDIAMVGGRKALQSISELAKKKNIDLMCFHLDLNQAINNMPASWDSIGEIPDGLVVYQAWRSEEIFRIFRNKFPALPMVTAGRLYKGCPGVAPDSFGGIRNILCHLVEVHGYRRIAFMLGPEGNWAAQERYRAYVETLQNYDIPIRSDLVTPNLGWDDARGGISILLDERMLVPGKDFDAIIGSNDSLALGGMEELRNRGVEVPGTTAVAGFDNDRRSFFSSPPLTTAEFNMGLHAAEILLEMLSGKQVPEQSFAPVNVVIRRSCGCQYLAVSEADTGHADQPVKIKPQSGIVPETRSRVIEKMSKKILEDGSDTDSVSRWMQQLFDSFISNLGQVSHDKSNPFILSLEKVLYEVIGTGSDLTQWQSVISEFRRQFLPHLGGRSLPMAENLWQQARVLIEEMARRNLLLQEEQAGQYSRILRNMDTALLSTFTLPGLADSIAQNLPKIGIHSIFLVLYDDSGFSRLILAYDESNAAQAVRYRHDSESLRFPTRLLVPDGMLSRRQSSYVVEPLSFQDHHLGCAVFETGPLDGSIYDRLRGTISTALQGALLLTQVQEHAAQLDAIVNHTLSASEEIQTTIGNTSQQVQIVSRASQKSMDVSKIGQEAVSSTVSGMKILQDQVEDIAKCIAQLAKHTQQIGEINKAVEDIISRSQVLGINASIQAARAGDKGLGFAVVAREMRNLAEQSAKATTHISSIVSEIKRAADDAVQAAKEGSLGARKGMELAGKAGETINRLTETIEEATRLALHISSGTDQQANAMDQLVQAVKRIKEANTQTSIRFKEAGL